MKINHTKESKPSFHTILHVLGLFHKEYLDRSLYYCVGELSNPSHAKPLLDLDFCKAR